MDKQRSLQQIVKFIIPSLIGLFLFMFPLSINGEITIPTAFLSGWIQNILYGFIPEIMLVIITITFVCTLITKIWAPKKIVNSSFWNGLFNVTNVWFIIRILAVIFAYITYFEWGPEWIWSEDTGGTCLSGEGLVNARLSGLFWAGL